MTRLPPGKRSIKGSEKWAFMTKKQVVLGQSEQVLGLFLFHNFIQTWGLRIERIL